MSPFANNQNGHNGQAGRNNQNGSNAQNPYWQTLPQPNSTATPSQGLESFSARRPATHTLPPFSLPHPTQDNTIPRAPSFTAGDLNSVASSPGSIVHSNSSHSHSSQNGLVGVGNYSQPSQNGVMNSNGSQAGPPISQAQVSPYTTGTWPMPGGQDAYTFAPATMNSGLSNGHQHTYASGMVSPSPVTSNGLTSNTLTSNSPGSLASNHSRAMPSPPSQQTVSGHRQSIYAPILQPPNAPAPTPNFGFASSMPHSPGGLPATSSSFYGSSTSVALPQSATYSTAYPTRTNLPPSTAGAAQHSMPSLAGQIPVPYHPRPLPGNYGNGYGGFSAHMTPQVATNLSTPGTPMRVINGVQHHHLSAGFQHHHHPSMPYGNYGGQAHQDRPFKCDICTQSFNRNHDLKRHKRIHLAVKPFPCKYCEKSFSRKDALKRHNLVKNCEGKFKEAQGQAQDDPIKSSNSSPEPDQDQDQDQGPNGEFDFSAPLNGISNNA